ncbi:MAG: hypothetical protein ACQEP9_07365 [Bacillota bacterium]
MAVEKLEEDVGLGEDFKIVKGKFEYGKYNDEVGMFMAIIGEEELKSWNLVMTDNPESQLTPIDGDYIVFKRIFAEIPIKDKKRSYKFKQQLQEELKESINELIVGSLTEVEEFFDRHIHLIAKEEVDLDLVVEEFSKGKLKSDFPQLFVTEDDDSEQSEETESEDIVIDCSVLIAPLTGKKFSNFEIGDKLLVEATGSDYKQLENEAPQVITDDNKSIGQIEEIKHNKDNDEYELSIKFGPQLYGTASIDSNSSIKLEVPYQQQKFDLTDYDYLYDRAINFLLIMLVLSVIILLITNLL